MNTDSLGLTGRTALITGGSRGIGAACATLLAERGAAVALTYSRSPDRAAAIVRAITAAGGTAHAIAADAGDADAVKAGVTQAIDRLRGHLDILVNNAGIAEHAPFGTSSDAAFERQLDVRAWSHSAATDSRARSPSWSPFWPHRRPATSRARRSASTAACSPDALCPIPAMRGTAR